MDVEDDFDDMDIEDNLEDEVNEVTSNLLPEKSKERYYKEYEQFREFCKKNNIRNVSDNCMLIYFSRLSKVMKPSTLWAKFSMIKSCLLIQDNVDCEKFPKTMAFLKRKSTGYKPKKSKTLSRDQVVQFILEAPDQTFLLSKVILIFGIFGACRRDDLAQLTVKDIEDNDKFLLVHLRDGKTHKSRSFTIIDDGVPFKPCDLYRKYAALRPRNVETDRFFIGYRNGKCISQNVGIHKIGGVPKEIAKYLKLENPEGYTGHALRRTSASILVENGGDLLMLKRHGGWKSSNVAEGYIEDSVRGKIAVSQKLFNATSPNIDDSNQLRRPNVETLETPSTSSCSGLDNISVVNNALPMNGINISNNTNCTFNFSFTK